MGADDLLTACHRAGVTDPRILDAVRAVDRTHFLPDQVRSRAGQDRPIPIGAGQTTSQPSLIAVMIQQLELGSHAMVLEIGTGSGYQTALLARIADHVVSVERDPDLSATAAARLSDLGNVEVVVGDGTLGWPARAPYDGITVGATGPRIPRSLTEQLAEGGRLVMPLAESGRERIVVLTRRGGEVVRTEPSLPVRFVPLVGEEGYAG